MQKYSATEQASLTESKETQDQKKKSSQADIDQKVSRLVASAPSSPKLQIDSIDLPETNARCNRRSKTCSEVNTKIRATITSERIAQLRKTVENAIRDHRVFSIKGGWPVVRRELIKRGWIERLEHGKIKQTPNEDVTSNLPAKQDWESPQTYVEKCERTVMSRMLSAYDCDFYWSMRKEPSDLQHRGNAYKLLNRFCRSLYASKEGLTLILQQSYWYTEEDVANVNFPRCYVLGYPDHYNLFVDDFRITSCMGLLKWFVSRHETKHEVHSIEGTVPHSAFYFALERITEYIASQKHHDIDKEITRVWDHEWEQFLGFFYAVVHQNESFVDFKDQLVNNYAQAKIRLKEAEKFWPQYNIDGIKNIWIMKPGNKCRGRGITMIKTLAEVDKIMSLKLKYVVQKYIEKPLIIYKTKFDIRQWFMVTNVQPLTIWMFKDSYLRFSGQNYSLDDFHESLHLTNHAIQCKYTNGQRDTKLPDDNMWDSHTFKGYLKQIGQLHKWNEVIFPGMKQNIICAMLASQETMDRRPNTFEVYGADFMLSEDFTPWLLEINCSPDLSYSTSVTSRMCPQCLEDIIKVVIDKRKDSNADTGLFDLIYKQNYPRTPPYLGMNLSVRGRKIFRNKTKLLKAESKENRDKSVPAPAIKVKKCTNVNKADILSNLKVARATPKPMMPGIYSGPIIEDLIEELHKPNMTPFFENVSGIDFVAAGCNPRSPSSLKEMDNMAFLAKKAKQINPNRGERVQKFCISRHRINQKSSLSRKPKSSASENTKPSSMHQRPSGLKESRRTYFGLFRQWASKNQSYNSRESWEKGTISILKGENILSSKSDSANSSSIDANKHFVKNLHTFDLNKLLPEINASCNSPY